VQELVLDGGLEEKQHDCDCEVKGQCHVAEPLSNFANFGQLFPLPEKQAEKKFLDVQ